MCGSVAKNKSNIVELTIAHFQFDPPVRPHSATTGSREGIAFEQSGVFFGERIIVELAFAKTDIDDPLSQIHATAGRFLSIFVIAVEHHVGRASAQSKVLDKIVPFFVIDRHPANVFVLCGGRWLCWRCLGHCDGHLSARRSATADSSQRIRFGAGRLGGGRPRCCDAIAFQINGVRICDQAPTQGA